MRGRRFNRDLTDCVFGEEGKTSAGNEFKSLDVFRDEISDELGSSLVLNLDSERLQIC